MTDRKKCTRCLVNILLSDYTVKRNGEYQKICNMCNLKNRERYKCKECEKTFQNNGKLNRHIDCVHKKIKEFGCDLCEIKFGSMAHLQGHIWYKHDISSSEAYKWHQCDLCDLKFKRNTDLQRHLWCKHDISSSEAYKWHQCDLCDSKFKTNGELPPHLWYKHDISSSESNKWHQCELCDLKFKTNGNLQEHLWHIHNISLSESYKYYVCIIDGCNLKFKTKGNLQKHIQICTGSLNISGLELRCIEALTELGFDQDYDYIHNNSYHKLTDWCGKGLRPDIRFINHKIFIELDGHQHFEPRNFGNIPQEQAQQNFEITQEHDKIKNDFCKEFGYKMIRISYKDICNILSILHVELEDILEI